MPNPSAGRLTNAQLRGLLGCARTQIIAWEKRGLPYVKGKGNGGSAPHLYDRGAALRWIAERGTGKWPLEAARLLRKEKQGAGGGRSAPPAAEGGRGGEDGAAESPGTGGAGGTLSDKITEALETSFSHFKAWAGAERRAYEMGKMAEAALCAKQRAEAGKAVAQLQSQLTEQAKEMGELVVASEMEGRYLKVLNTVKNNVTVIPESVIPVILPFLRDPEDAAKVRDVITGRVEDALRHIADAEVD